MTAGMHTSPSLVLARLPMWCCGLGENRWVLHPARPIKVDNRVVASVERAVIHDPTA